MITIRNKDGELQSFRTAHDATEYRILNGIYTIEDFSVYPDNIADMFSDSYKHGVVSLFANKRLPKMKHDTKARSVSISLDVKQRALLAKLEAMMLVSKSEVVYSALELLYEKLTED